MSDRGNFFVVDRRCAEAICNRTDGINTAVAYLVLARFASGKNHSSTKAGVTALHSNLGLSRGRSDGALKALENSGFISSAGRGGMRKLISWGEHQAELAGLSDKQRLVLARVKGKSNPIISGSDPDYQTAYALIKKGALALTDAQHGKSKFRLPDPDYLFLPNSLIDGFREGDAPLARLRQIGDARAISTLLRVYYHANLPEDGGIPPAAIRKGYERFEVAKYGQFTVWGFAPDGLKASWDPFITPFVENQDKTQRERITQEFWMIWKALISARLVEHVGYIMENSGDGAQPIHPFPTEGGTEEERRVFQAASEAGIRMASEAQIARALDLGDVRALCPIRSHVLDAQLVGIARPVHRANTSRTRAWARNFLLQCEGHAAIFSDLAQSSTRATA